MSNFSTIKTVIELAAKAAREQDSSRLRQMVDKLKDVFRGIEIFTEKMDHEDDGKKEIIREPLAINKTIIGATFQHKKDPTLQVAFLSMLMPDQDYDLTNNIELMLENINAPKDALVIVVGNFKKVLKKYPLSHGRCLVRVRCNAPADEPQMAPADKAQMEQHILVDSRLGIFVCSTNNSATLEHQFHLKINVMTHNMSNVVEEDSNTKFVDKKIKKKDTYDFIGLQLATTWLMDPLNQLYSKCSYIMMSPNKTLSGENVGCIIYDDKKWEEKNISCQYAVKEKNSKVSADTQTPETPDFLSVLKQGNFKLNNDQKRRPPSLPSEENKPGVVAKAAIRRARSIFGYDSDVDSDVDSENEWSSEDEVAEKLLRLGERFANGGRVAEEFFGRKLTTNKKFASRRTRY